MAKKKCPECPECIQDVPKWMVQFGDLMSLLLVFFVLLLSMATFDPKKVTEAVGSLTGALSVLEGGFQTEVSVERPRITVPVEQTPETAEVVQMVERVISEVEQMLKEEGAREVISLEESEEGFMIRMPANLLFQPGSAKIYNEDALLFLKRVSMMITKLPNEMEVVVRGHTDDGDIPLGSLYRDNWELSSARAVTVVKELIHDGVRPQRLTAAGHANYRPIATNATEEGRARNRRVELHFIGADKGDKGGAKSSVLDSAN